MKFKIGLQIHKQIVRRVIQSTPIGQRIILKYYKFLAPDLYYGQEDEKESLLLRIAQYTGGEIKTSDYRGNLTSGYELDELPPSYNSECLRIAKKVSCILRRKMVKTSVAMRKHVYDMSIASGFQRSMLITDPREPGTEFRKLILKDIYLEEDSTTKTEIGYSTKRSATALLEIVTQPLETSLEGIFEIISSLKELNKMIDDRCYLKTPQAGVRQDVNIGYLNSIVQIKGVEDISSLEPIVKNELERLVRLDSELSSAQHLLVWDSIRVDIRCTEFITDLKKMTRHFKLVDSETMEFRLGAQWWPLVGEYLNRNYSCTRGLNSELKTVLNRGKGKITRMHVETDLEQVQWQSINQLNSTPDTIRADLNLMNYDKIPYCSRIWSILKRAEEAGHNSVVIYVDSNLEKFRGGVISENVQKFYNLYSVELVDFNYLREGCSAAERLALVRPQTNSLLVHSALEKKYSMKDALKYYGSQIPNKKKYIEEFTRLTQSFV